jgi:hypothetical protein
MLSSTRPIQGGISPSQRETTIRSPPTRQVPRRTRIKLDRPDAIHYHTAAVVRPDGKELVVPAEQLERLLGVVKLDVDPVPGLLWLPDQVGQAELVGLVGHVGQRLLGSMRAGM